MLREKNEIYPLTKIAKEGTENWIPYKEELVHALFFKDSFFELSPSERDAIYKQIDLLVGVLEYESLGEPEIRFLQAWEQLKDWTKPTLTLISESMAKRGFPPKELHDQMPGTAGQPHETYPDTGFFLIEDEPEKLAQKTIKFIQAS